MNKFVASLVIFALPVAAHAEGIMKMQSVKTQIKNTAKSDQAFPVGAKLNITTVTAPKNGKTGLVKATVSTKGALLPGMKPSWEPYATAEFKTEQTIDGRVAEPIKQDGQVWQHMLYAR